MVSGGVTMIRTVLGDINKEELGTTLAHEHFIIDLARIRHDNYSLIETVEEVVPEIKAAMDTGIEAAFEVSTIDLSRDAVKLREISRITGLKIVCSTGFYLTQYHPEWLDDASAEDIAQVYIKELLHTAFLFVLKTLLRQRFFVFQRRQLRLVHL